MPYHSVANELLKGAVRMIKEHVRNAVQNSDETVSRILAITWERRQDTCISFSSEPDEKYTSSLLLKRNCTCKQKMSNKFEMRIKVTVDCIKVGIANEHTSCPINPDYELSLSLL